ncbi:Tripartite-type tricarboxylate transporter, receptor component TctC [Variovorax sp. OK605]|uniref:tripartite tricarboxylate transporter substrate-binding protein n=1 Tax=Variovorax sp. OK605 TaxID=1855317 RepID=UPI0008E447CB|nr:Tripartite-type tricarboxylate transporter, receptor component TctC [Variovorax sp. OK605]
MKKKRLLLCVLPTLALAHGTTAMAQYPDKPITLVVPFTAGGPTDRVARDFAEALRKALGGQTVIIDNAAGAGGNIGAAKVARAAPDGYTLLLHNIAMATSPALYRKLPYKPLDDFEYLGMVSEVPMTLIGRPNLPVSNLAELTRLVLAETGKVTIANAGVGSASHLCGLLYEQAIKGSMVAVPYKGTAPAMSELLGGQVDLMCDQTTNTSAQIAAGKVKVFGVTTVARIRTPQLASVPTFDEGGLKDFRVSVWHGLYAPKGTPAAVLEKLNAALEASLKDADFQRREADLGAVVVTDDRAGREAHKSFVAKEIQRWAPVLKAVSQNAE